MENFLCVIETACLAQWHQGRLWSSGNRIMIEVTFLRFGSSFLLLKIKYLADIPLSTVNELALFHTYNLQRTISLGDQNLLLNISASSVCLGMNNEEGKSLQICRIFMEEFLFVWWWWRVVMVVFVVVRDKREVFVTGGSGGWQISRLDRTSISAAQTL